MLKTKIIIIVKKIFPHSFRIKLRKLNWKLKYFFLTLGKTYSDNVFCPIAGKEFKTFIKLGNDLQTYSNGARSRQRLVWLYLKNELKILENNLKILHIAPELSYFEILKKQKNIRYFPGDKMVDGYSNQKGINNIDLLELIYENNYFDLIICNYVLEHIFDDKKAISEMYRVLKNNGIAVVTVPLDENAEKTNDDPTIQSPQDRQKYFGQWDHLRMYSIDIKDKFNEAGFKTKLIRYSEKISGKDMLRMGLCNDLIIVAEKF